MADPDRDAPRHPPHPGNYAGNIPDDRAGGRRAGGRRFVVILAVLVLVLAAVWLMIGGGDTVGEQTLGEPAGVGESATAVDGGAEMPEEPQAAIGAADESSTALAREEEGEEDAAE